MLLGSRLVLGFFISGDSRGPQMKPHLVVERSLGLITHPIISLELSSMKHAVIVGDRSSTGLATLSVCDPACGAGQFLVTWFEELLSAEVGIAKELANNVYGVDLDPIGVWLCRVSFWAALFTRGCEPKTEFFRGIFGVGNSLIGAEWKPKKRHALTTPYQGLKMFDSQSYSTRSGEPCRRNQRSCGC